LLELLALWEPHSDGKALQEALLSRGIADAAQLVPLLVELPRASRLRRLDAIGRRRLAALLECLLTQLPAQQPLLLLRRLVSIIEAIGQRSAYFSLLLENSAARQRLLTVCAQGEFLAGRIAAHPLLLSSMDASTQKHKHRQDSSRARPLQLHKNSSKGLKGSLSSTIIPGESVDPSAIGEDAEHTPASIEEDNDGTQTI
jgi:glutamine synthetase adenylyltransferase